MYILTRGSRREIRRDGVEFAESILYGLIQGLTEFLPISSSGHLALIEAITGGVPIGDQLAFNVLLHLGTLVAVIAVYRKDICKLIRSSLTLIGKLLCKRIRAEGLDENERTVICLTVSSLPLIPAALLEDRVAYVSGQIAAIGARMVP